MSDILHSSHRLVPLLTELLGLPEHMRWFELRMHVREIATVRCEYYPQPYEVFRGEDGEKRLRTIVQEFEVTKVERRKPKIEVRAGLCSEAATIELNAWFAETFGYAEAI